MSRMPHWGHEPWPTHWLHPYPARSGFIVPWQAEILAAWRCGA